MLEEWRDIPGWPHYQASSSGRIRSIDRYIEFPDGRGRRAFGKIIRQYKLTGGRYMAVSLNVGTVSVHSLVALAFIGERPDGMQVCHTNGDMHDNAALNLRYDTPSANGYDQVNHGRHFNKRKTHCPRGHRLEVPNLTSSWEKLGHRCCKSCASAHSAKRYGTIGSESEIQAYADMKYRSLSANFVS